MAKNTLLSNAKIINEGEIYSGEIILEGDLIKNIIRHDSKDYQEFRNHAMKDQMEIHDLKFKYVMPGMIDGQVHFREPGLTHKGDLETESRAAVAGGITSFMEMPNTHPRALTQELLAEKFELASQKSHANYSFYMGTSNDNLAEVLKTDPKTVCGVKIFMGASTGNMLVDNDKTLNDVFSQSPMLIATHCEDEATININTKKFIELHGEDLSVDYHPLIRNHEACFRSSEKAVNLAKKYGTRLHVLHLTTADDLKLFDNKLPVREKRITAEVCCHHLWFSDEDYESKGALIKWNPAVKTKGDREALQKAVRENILDIIATDHSPHTLEEKNNPYFKSPAGAPMVQHALNVLFELHVRGKLGIEKIVEKVAHSPAHCFQVGNRGFIRKGYKADLTVFSLDKSERAPSWTVDKSNILYKCGWSPLKGTKFHSKIHQTFINGVLVYDNGVFNEDFRGERLTFAR